MCDQATAAEARKSIATELAKVKIILEDVDEKVEKIVDILCIETTPLPDSEKEKVALRKTVVNQQISDIRRIYGVLQAMHPRLNKIIEEVSGIG